MGTPQDPQPAPGLVHAFAAAPARRRRPVIAPGVQRCESFRRLARTAYGKVPPEGLPAVQEFHAIYFLTNPTRSNTRP
ncbi:hypothetical protein ACFWBB_11025 [Streptomyces sp. NPDC060000]|uniref:hypothetical protein n=1 Tax=Streptomyces sp. NPDC060000 TaxID=3347031 RepID=UPI0036B5ABA4